MQQFSVIQVPNSAFASAMKSTDKQIILRLSVRVVRDICTQIVTELTVQGASLLPPLPPFNVGIVEQQYGLR